MASSLSLCIQNSTAELASNSGNLRQLSRNTRCKVRLIILILKLDSYWKNLPKQHILWSQCLCFCGNELMWHAQEQYSRTEIWSNRSHGLNVSALAMTDLMIVQLCELVGGSGLSLFNCLFCCRLKLIMPYFGKQAACYKYLKWHSQRFDLKAVLLSAGVSSR